MRVSYEWLREFVDFDLSPEELVRELTLVGIESHLAEKPELNFRDVVAGKIIDVKAFEAGSHLHVDIGGEILSIYSTAPGLNTGMLVPVAKVGGSVGAKKIEATEFNGMPSHGMACSEAELGLGHHAVSLMVLDPSEMKPGDDLAIYLSAYRGIEIELTANRTDCWSFLGVAREIGAICGTIVKPLPVREDIGIEKDKDETIQIYIRDPKLSGAYVGLLFPEVVVKPSPLSVVRKLISIGLRPINNIVDITNMVLYETGQPSHAFDYDLIIDQMIEVRPARPGEKMTTLDDVERELLTTDVVIADGAGPVALAGVMGGHRSEITFTTERMFLENAHFDPVSIRRTSRRTGLRTDASVRFERGIDPAGIRRSGRRTAWWVDKLGCGKSENHMVEVSSLSDAPKVVLLRDERMEKILGYKMDDARVDSILNGLGFSIAKSGGKREVTVPSFRLDISIEEDLIEEVARHFRYDNLPSTLPLVHMKNIAFHPSFAAAHHFKNLLSGLGLWETSTYATGSIGFNDLQNPIVPDAKSITFLNPLTEDHACLRTHLLPSLLGVMRHNLRHGVEPRDIFEIANVFNCVNGGYDQYRQIAIMSLNKRGKGKKGRETEEAGYLRVKGLCEKFISAIGSDVSGIELLNGDSLYPFRIEMKTANGTWGFIGKVSDEKLDEFDIPQSAYFALLDFSLCEKTWYAGLKARKYQALERYPSITRDLALLVGEEVLYGDVERIIRETGGELLREVKLFDVFRSEKIGEGLKQYAFSLRYNHPDRTLTDEDVSQSVGDILAAAGNKVGAKLRDW